MYTFFMEKTQTKSGFETHIFKLYDCFLNKNALFYVKTRKKGHLY